MKKITTLIIAFALTFAASAQQTVDITGKNASTIASEINTALDKEANTIVTVTGTQSINGAGAVSLTLPEGKAVVWRANYSTTVGSNVSLEGAGSFEVVEGSIVNRATNAGATAIDCGVTYTGNLTISGGRLEATNAGRAVGTGNVSRPSITITGGILRNTTGTLISLASPSFQTLTVTGGTLFTYGTEVPVTGNIGNAVAIAWNNTAWEADDNPDYVSGELTHLVSSPANSARWNYTAQGIINTMNGDVIQIASVIVMQSSCTEHDFSEWLVTTPVDCYTDGIRTEICSICGALGVITEIIPSTMKGLDSIIVALRVDILKLETENAALINDTLRLFGQVTTLQGNLTDCNTNNGNLQSQIDGLKTDTTNLNILIRALQLDTVKLGDSIRILLQKLADCENNGTSNANLIPQEHIQVFPNPVSYELRIVNYDFQQGDIVELFDMNGRRVYSAPANNSEIKIDMSNFQSGNYILRIGNRVARIVKQ